MCLTRINLLLSVCLHCTCVLITDNTYITIPIVFCCREGQGFHEGLLLGGHNGFVSAVCVLPPDEECPHGLIMTGSNDNVIHAYTLSSPEPVYKLTGHTGNGRSL